MTLNISKIDKREVPKLAVPGRTREPSEFDEYLPNAYEDGEWRIAEFENTENLAELLNELARSASHFKYGTSKRALDANGEVIKLTELDDLGEVGSGTFYFCVRDKLATGRRGPRNVAEDDALVTDESDVESESENGSTKGGKRGRKANATESTEAEFSS